MFILPPFWDMLKQSLGAWGSDAPEEIERRLKKARDEITCFNEYEIEIEEVDEVEAEAYPTICRPETGLSRRRELSDDDQRGDPGRGEVDPDGTQQGVP